MDNNSWPQDTREQRFDYLLMQMIESKSYSRFCLDAYGVDLCQLNMMDSAQLNHIIKLSDLDENKRFLDMGCGAGRLTKYIQSQTGASGVGVDLSSQMIAHLSAQNDENIQYVQGDLNRLAIKQFAVDNSFDAVFFIDSWYFLEDPSAVLEKLKPSLKQQALIFITFSNYKRLEALADCDMYKTVVANALSQCGFSFSCLDFSANDKRLWRSVKASLAKHKQDFISEGYETLHNIRCVESDKKNIEITTPSHFRYLYVAHFKKMH